MIWSPMPSGSGAIEVHRRLAEQIDGYTVRPFDPRFEYCPPLLGRFRKPDAALVHATPDHGALLVVPGQPLVITFHNFVLDEGMGAYSSPLQRLHYRTDLRWLTRAALRRAQAVTAVSTFTAGLVERFFDLETPVRVIENGVDVDRFAPAPPPPDSPIRVLVSGNPSRRKGTDRIAAIARRLAPGIQIACTIDERDRRRWIGDAPNVIALGKRSAGEMPALYRSAHLLLMPTAREGFGLAVAEAMACGLPVVSSDASTMPDLVAHGEGGFVCPLDSPDAFASRINQLAADPLLRERMGRFNRQRAVQRFSLAAMAAAYRELFDEVLAAFPASSRSKHS